MTRQEQTEQSLHRRVSDLLRDSNSLKNPFSANVQTVAHPTEIDVHEFELERAMVDLRVAQARVDKLKQEILQMKE